MSANASKTKYIIFHNKGKPANTYRLDLYFNDNEPPDILNPTNIHILEPIHNNNPNLQSRLYKLLGIHLDEHLSLNCHFSILSNKLSRALFFLRRLKIFYPPMLFSPFIIPSSTATYPTVPISLELLPIPISQRLHNSREKLLEL
jgi:hypothetical protein